MRRYLLLAFLGIWTALVPFVLYAGSTQTLVLVVTGLLVAALALWSLRDSHIL